MKLFDILFGRAIDKRIAAYQNDLISKHCEEVQNMYRQVRGWRHDFAGHVQNMSTLLANQQYDELADYINKMGIELKEVDTVIKTGNVMVDSALNSKLNVAANKKITVNVKASVPSKTTVSEVELCAILSNLLANAIEGCMMLEDPADRFIRVYIDTLKDQLYISVSNSYLGTRRRENGRFHTTKAEKSSHGFGLLRIDRIAKKYGGFVNRQSEVGVFATEIMLPL